MGRERRLGNLASGCWRIIIDFDGRIGWRYGLVLKGDMNSLAYQEWEPDTHTEIYACNDSRSAFDHEMAGRWLMQLKESKVECRTGKRFGIDGGIIERIIVSPELCETPSP